MCVGIDRECPDCWDSIPDLFWVLSTTSRRCRRWGTALGWGEPPHTLTPLCLRDRLTSLGPARPPRRSSNVFITCLTRSLIASPLNGAVTVETRNKRPPENEMIKQVTLAKQIQPGNLGGGVGWGEGFPDTGFRARPRTPPLRKGQMSGSPPAGHGSQSPPTLPLT